MQLLKDNVLLKKIQGETKLGSIIIPESVNLKSQWYWAEVVNVGPGTEKNPMPAEIVPGAIVFHRPGSDRSFEENDDTRFLVKASDIWAVVSK